MTTESTRNPFGIVPKEIFELHYPDGETGEPTKLPPPAIALFVALATFANADRYARPGIGTLAVMIGLNRRNTVQHLRKLHAAGAISIEARHDESGRQTSNGYVLDLLKSSRRGVASDMDEGVASDTRTVQEGTVPEEQSLGACAPRGTDFVWLSDKKEVELAFDHWNQFATDNGLRGAGRLTPGRRGALKQRIREAGGLDAFKGAVNSIATSDFLMGRNDNGWQATFGWLLQEEMFLKLVEGTYHHGGQPSGTAAHRVAPL